MSKTDKVPTTLKTMAKHFSTSVQEMKNMLDSMVAAGILVGYDDEKMYFNQGTLDLFQGLSPDPVMRDQQIHQLVDGVMRVREVN